MARAEDQKNLQADIRADLHDRLTTWINDHNDVKLRQCVQAMIELWLLLPEHLQAILLITKPESEPFGWVAEYTGRNLMQLADAFEVRTEAAPLAVRHLLCLLSDYAETRNSIATNGDLHVALNAFREMLRWLEPRFSGALEASDKEAVEGLVAVLDRWEETPSSVVNPLDAVRGIVDAMQPDTIHLLSLEEQKKIDQVRRVLGPADTAVVTPTRPKKAKSG
jgi:hypothetical protein